MLADVLPPSAAAGAIKKSESSSSAENGAKCRHARRVPLLVGQPPVRCDEGGAAEPEAAAPQYQASRRLPGTLVVRGCWLGDELLSLPPDYARRAASSSGRAVGRGHRSRAAPLSVGCVWFCDCIPGITGWGWRRPYLPVDSASGQRRPASR